MRIARLYVDADLEAPGSIELDAAAAERLTRVLRLRRGDPVALFNGDGLDYRATIEPVGKGRVQVRIDSSAAAVPESPLALCLLQSLARGEKMDWVLQKATELGVAAIRPLVTERTEVKLEGDRLAARMRHWRSVVVAACEQCGRAVVPPLAEPVALDRLADAALPKLRLALHPGGAHLRSNGLAPRLHEAAADDGVALAIGPEGGFSELDLRLLGRAGFQPLSLGPRTLRTETAGAAALAALQSLHGDLG